VLRLVRPCSYALTLGLGLVASEVCIPLIQRCLRAPCLYIGGACSLAVWERLAGRHTGDPLARGEGPGLSTELPDRELGPCEGFLVRGSNED
jgi:hypothetical protein